MAFRRKPNLLILAAWLLHALAWFLPVVKESVLPLLPGWEAFREALTAFYDPGGFTSWYGEVIAAVSAVGTVLFIFGSPWVVLRPSRSLSRACAWAAAIAAVVNTQWYVLSDATGRSELRIGYFLWCLSFAVLAVGLFVLAGQKPALPIAQDSPAPSNS